MIDNSNKYSNLFNKEVFQLFINVLKISAPHYIIFILKTLFYQHLARRKRLKLDREGLWIPPFMILSVTGKCNLNCAGCYSHELNKSVKPEMADKDLSRIIKESKDIGISIV